MKRSMQDMIGRWLRRVATRVDGGIGSVLRDTSLEVALMRALRRANGATAAESYFPWPQVRHDDRDLP